MAPTELPQAPSAAPVAEFIVAAAPPVAAPVEPDSFSVEWAPAADSAAAAAPSPAQMPASSPEPRLDEPANPAQSPAESGGYIEKYQRLFSGEAADPERAILAAIDAVIQGPSAESPREEAPAPAAVAPAVSQAAPFAAPLPASAGPALVSEPAALTAAHAAPAEAAAPSSQASKLDLGRDVDWSEDVLARAARAAAAAATRARAQQQTELAAGGASSQRSPAAQPAQSRARSSRSEIDEGVASERSARHKTRKQQARRARLVATPLFLFAFVGCVMVALGVGFVTGFMIGRETPRTAEATPPRAAEPEGPVAAEPAASAAEAAAPRKKGALTSRVEAVVPQPGAPGAPGLAGEPAAGAAPAPGAVAKFQRAPFDPKAAGAAVSRAGARAGICVQPGDAGGEAVVTVTLDPSGVTSSAAVYGARFSGTQAGECIAGLMREVKVRPFKGDPVTVKKTIQVR